MGLLLLVLLSHQASIDWFVHHLLLPANRDCHLQSHKIEGNSQLSQSKNTRNHCQASANFKMWATCRLFIDDKVLGLIKVLRGKPFRENKKLVIDNRIWVRHRWELREISQWKGLVRAENFEIRMKLWQNDQHHQYQFNLIITIIYLCLCFLVFWNLNLWFLYFQGGGHQHPSRSKSNVQKDTSSARQVGRNLSARFGPAQRDHHQWHQPGLPRMRVSIPQPPVELHCSAQEHEENLNAR